MSTRFVGIDLNGLIDQACLRDDKGERFTLGEIPSIIVVPEKQPLRARQIDVVSGREASRSFEGRGWSWPEIARKHGDSRRVPINSLLEAIANDELVQIDGVEYKAADLVAAAIQGLGARQGSDEKCVVVVRDNGTFTDEVQERLIYALTARGLSVTLLWRSVAAVLGLEDDLNLVASRISGKRIGVISVLTDGIDISVLTLECRTDAEGSYLVPVREKQGVFAPYSASIFECAEQFALALAAGDEDVAYQLMWGGGAAIGAYLMGHTGVTPVQDKGKWRLFDISMMKQTAQLPILEGVAADLAKDQLRDIDLVVFEGPASDARSTNFRMVYQLRDALIRDGANVLKYGLIHENEGLAAKGAVRYGRRVDMDRRTYYDYLPTIRFAAMKGESPAFIDLIPSTERLEGGHAYGPKVFDLGLWLEPGTTSLTNYLIKELSPDPRVSKIELRSRPAQRIPVKVKIYQKPLAGLARISLIADNTDDFGPIDLDWGQMEIDGRTEEEILASIQPASNAVPPIQPTSCHSALWTEGSATYPPLVSLLGSMGMVQLYSRPSEEFDELVTNIYKRLYRSDTLNRITSGADPDKTPYRAISSLGEAPTPDDRLKQSDIDRLDLFIAELERLIVQDDITLARRRRLATTCSWTYSRCPTSVAKLLGQGIFDQEERVFPPQTQYQCLGRIASNERDIRRVFLSLQNIEDYKIYHIRAVTSILSRIETAGKCVTVAFAERMALFAIKRIEKHYKVQPSSAFISASLQLIAALLRGRTVNPDLLDPEKTALGKKAVEIMRDFADYEYSLPRNIKLATSVVEWLQKRGTDSGVLSQENDDEEASQEDE